MEAKDAPSLVKSGITLSRYVSSLPDGPKLKGGRGKYRLSCIVHGGDNPSGMSIDDGLGLWHCFTSDCGGGDIISLVMKMEDVEFGEALEKLAFQAGVTLPERNSLDNVSRKRIYAALDDLTDAANEYLLFGDDEDAEEMRDYLRFRRFTKKSMLREWGIGMIPSRKRDALRFVKKATDDHEALIAAGVIDREDGKFVPLHGRLIFPIMNANGDVAGYSGRAIDEIPHSFKGKYINSPGSPVYNKSKILYGMNYLHSENTEHVVITEGNLDNIACNRAFDCDEVVAVAACGTSVGEGHIREIIGHTNKDVRITFLMDGDKGGTGAIAKILWVANIHPNTDVVTLYDDQDPWDVFLESEKSLRKALKDSTPLIEAVVDAQWEKSGKDEVFLGDWVKDTYHTLSFTQDKDRLVSASAAKVGKDAEKYRRDMASTISLDSRRNRRRGEITNINPISSPMRVIIGAMLKMSQDERDGVLAPFYDWDDDCSKVVESWMPVQNQIDVDAIQHIAMGLDAPHRPDIEREIVDIIGEDREYDLSNALKAMSRQFLTAIQGSRSSFMISQIRCLQRLSSVCHTPSEQASALGWLTSLAIDFQRESEAYVPDDSRQRIAN